jgi:hypothetical protein
MLHNSTVKLRPDDKNRTRANPTVPELPSQQQLSELPRRAAVFLAAEALASIESGYRLPEDAPEREFYERCLSSVVNSGRKFAAAEEIDPHEAPGMAAASVISGVKSSSFANDRLQQAAASCASAARLVALAIARAKGEGARAAEDTARYAAEALQLAVSAANEAELPDAKELALKINAAFDRLRQAGLGQHGELGRAIVAAEFADLMESDGASE